MSAWNRLIRHQPAAYTSHFERVLGTSMELQLVAESSTLAREAEQAVLDEIERLERIFSAYRPDSELNRWQQTHESSVAVSQDLAEVLYAAEQWRIATKGAFQPAVEALTRLWKEAATQGSEPDGFRIAALLTALSSTLWSVDLDSKMARRNTQLPVTLNAIAKGRILDLASECAASRRGISAVLLNIGGDVRHIGECSIPALISDPFRPQENAPPLASIRIQNQGLATSGGYRRGFQIGDCWRSHLIDPRTGLAVERTASVTVVAPNAMQADVLATAFSVMTVQESLQMSEAMSSVALLVVAHDRTHSANLEWRRIAS